MIRSRTTLSLLFFCFFCSILSAQNDSSFVASVQIFVSESADDAEQYPSGEMYLNSSDIELTYDDDSGEQQIGIRFQNISIPANAIISNAYIQFTVDESTDVATALEIKLHDIGNAPTFAETTFNISTRPLSQAEVI